MNRLLRKDDLNFKYKSFPSFSRNLDQVLDELSLHKNSVNNCLRIMRINITYKMSPVLKKQSWEKGI